MPLPYLESELHSVQDVIRQAYKFATRSIHIRQGVCNTVTMLQIVAERYKVLVEVQPE